MNRPDSIPLPEDRTNWRSVELPALPPVPPTGAGKIHLAKAVHRVDSWYRALQRVLEDPRPLRCERVWLNASDHDRLTEWISAPLLNADTAARRTWDLEWAWTCPSWSAEVPEGTVLIEPGAWDPPSSHDRRSEQQT